MLLLPSLLFVSIQIRRYFVFVNKWKSKRRCIESLFIRRIQSHYGNTKVHTITHGKSNCAQLLCVVRSFVFFILVDKLKHMYTYSYQLEIIEIFCAQHTLYSNAIQWWISYKYTSQRSNINWTVFVFCLKRKLSRYLYSAILQIFAFVQFLKTIAMQR